VQSATTETLAAPPGATTTAPPTAGTLDRAVDAAGLTTRVKATVYELRWTIAIYIGTRALLLAVAIVNGALRHHPVLNELANWDGFWYRSVANKGYPTFPSHAQTNLGFFPLFPMAAWAVAHLLTLTSTHSEIWRITFSGAAVSMVGGLAATVIVHRLAEGWWDKQTADRAAALFAIFPGSVVFSMVYAEGLIIPLAAGCILALERRRWLVAGILAGVATAAGPEAFMLIPACLVAAFREFRRYGYGFGRSWRSLIPTAMAPIGAASFAVFLWSWTGTPMANYYAQHYGWQEKTDPLALWNLTVTMTNQLTHTPFNHPTINLNLIVGFLGAFVLAWALWCVFRARTRISPEAIAWTLGISFLCVTSEYIPPNPRLLITSFPAILAIARFAQGRAYKWLIGVNVVLLIGLSALTFVGFTLRP
jgi:hypothetical protein